MTEVTYASENQLVNAYLAETDSDKGILLFHDIFGYRLPEIRVFADLLRAKGYVVLLPDLYRGNPWRPDADWSGHETWRQSHSLQRVMVDVINANQYLRSKVKKVASIGFCWGGDITFNFAQTEQCDAAIICYGTRMNAVDAANLKCPVLAMFGDSDPVIPSEQVQQFGNALTQAPVEHDLRIFPGAGHAFVHRPQPAGQATAHQALQEILQWLSKHL